MTSSQSVSGADGLGRTRLISGNWKMNHNHFEAMQTVQKLSFLLAKHDYRNVEVSIHPPFTDIRTVQTLLDADRIPFSLGAQNCHEEAKGAFTGEVSAQMLNKLNVRYVIVGHSERRQIFGETDVTVNKKLKAVFASSMTPILCVGETLEEREAGEANDRVESQLRAGLDGIPSATLAAPVIAYEPIWAIGTGRTASSEDAQAMCGFIRQTLGEIVGEESALGARIQYGGSVKPSNTSELISQPDIDGALVGGASLDADEFAAIVTEASK